MDTTNASDAYRAARERLDERLKTLDHLLRAHGAKQFRDQTSWGYEGSINHVVEMLDEAIAHLGGERT